MAMEKVAEISIYKLEDRKVVTGVRKKTPTGKQLDYYLKIYRDTEAGNTACGE